MSKDLYAILGCVASANPEEIKRAYRKAALASHPDKNPDDPTAAARFREVRKAWLVLSDESQRSAYDARQRGEGGGSFDDDYFRRYYPGTRRYTQQQRPQRQHQRQKARPHPSSSSSSSDSSDDGDGVGDGGFSSFGDFRRQFSAEFFDDDDARMPSWDELFRDEGGDSSPRERALRNAVCGAVGAAVLCLGLLWCACSTAAILFPPPLTLSNAHFGDRVSLTLDFRAFTQHLKLEHAQNDARFSRMFARGLVEGRLGLRTHTPFVRVSYNFSDLIRPTSPWLRSQLPKGAMVLCSKRRVSAKIFRLCTYVQPADTPDEGQPTRWPPTPKGRTRSDGSIAPPELCIRLLKSGTITSKPWFGPLSEARDVLGDDGRLRPFGFTAVRLDECRRSLGIPAIALSALAGGMFLGVSLGSSN